MRQDPPTSCSASDMSALSNESSDAVGRKSSRRNPTSRQDAAQGEFSRALHAKNLEKIKISLDKGADPNDRYITRTYHGEPAWKRLLAEGGTRENYEILRVLLERGADPDLRLADPTFREKTALNRAVYLGHYPIAALLLEFKADPDLTAYNGSLRGQAGGREDELPTLIIACRRAADAEKKLAKIDPSDETPGAMKARRMYRQLRLLIEMLLKGGADPKIKGKLGYRTVTPSTEWGEFDAVVAAVTDELDGSAATAAHAAGAGGAPAAGTAVAVV